MGINQKRKQFNKWAVLIGVGLALFPVHNLYLTNLTTSGGVAGFFLPAFGAALWVMGTLLFTTWNWDTIRRNGLGDKRVFIPLLVIILAIGLSGITAETIGGKLSPLLMGISLFSLYLVARVLGRDIFLPLAVGAGIASLGVVIVAVQNPGELTGGLIFEQNYDIVVGYVLLGTALFIRKYQWLLACLALVAMFMTGSPEGIFAVGVLGVVVVARRDWGKRLVIAVAPIVLIGVILFSFGYGQALFSYALQIVQGEDIVSHTEIGQTLGVGAINYRVDIIKMALSNMSLLGEGYCLTAFKETTVHNVPLVLIQQMGFPGILAGVAWLFVSIYCLIKTRWKYAWALVLSLSVFDHFIWTQLAPLWWAIVGVSMTSDIKSDLVFRK